MSKKSNYFWRKFAQPVPATLTTPAGVGNLFVLAWCFDDNDKVFYLTSGGHMLAAHQVTFVRKEL